MKTLAILAVIVTLAYGEILSATVNKDYALNRPLRVGDRIAAWGIYNDDSTSKFNLNIKGDGDLFLLHIDFRPYLKNAAGQGPIVLNNKVGGWKAEVRPTFNYGSFGKGKIFKVEAEVGANDYTIYFNDKEVGKFPQRNPISQAKKAVLYGGSKGFQWIYIEIPGVDRGVLGGNQLGNVVLKPGSVVSAWGIYATGSAKFSVNLRKADGNYMIHVDFRPPPHENKVVLNSYVSGWQKEIRTALPKFENGKVFRVDIYCGVDRFYIYQNNVQLGATFAYRPGFKLSDIKTIDLHGGSNSFQWVDRRVIQL